MTQDVQYIGNGTAGREADVRPTGFFFQMPKRTWVGLTDEDRKQISKEANYHWEMTTGEYAERIGQLTEAKLKEKNT